MEAEGKESARMLPATSDLFTYDTKTAVVQVFPPSVDRHAIMLFSLASAEGTITTPLGCTNGWPPIQVTPFVATVHDNPPSVEVAIISKFPLPISSH